MIFFLKKKLFYFLLSFNWKMTRDRGIMDIFRQNCHFSNVLVVWGGQSLSVDSSEGNS
jgi:hypothetical protein